MLELMVNRKKKLQKTKSWWTNENNGDKLRVSKIQSCTDMIADYSETKRQNIVRFEVSSYIRRKLTSILEFYYETVKNWIRVNTIFF